MNINNVKPMPSGQISGSNIDAATLNDIRDTVKLIRGETNILFQKSVCRS